ncbi:MAG: hypothetical protein KAH35_07130, partial [Candidatus Atribacteria bacterium]|nr:hypothetical protein [Candidatus Atribacteria bacterium]
FSFSIEIGPADPTLIGLLSASCELLQLISSAAIRNSTRCKNRYFRTIKVCSHTLVGALFI